MRDTQMNMKLKIKTDMKIYKLQRGYVKTVNSSWPVSTWMSDQLRAGKPSSYVTSHPDRLSLVIHLWIGTVSTGSSLHAMG